MIDRRALLMGAGGLAAAPLLGAASPIRVELPMVKVGERDLLLMAMWPDKPKGVVLFSHGAGGAVENYLPLFMAWTAADFTVVAPTHVDSRNHAHAADYDLRQAFPLRIADLAAASDWAKPRWAGLPLVAAGHSYGSLIAMIAGGALEPMVHARNPDVAAVVAFSTPGAIPGLIGPDAFKTLAAPTLTITGDADLVPGFVPDWHAHLAAFETSPAPGRMAFVGQGVDHFFGGSRGLEGKAGRQKAAFDSACKLSALFIAARLGDEVAGRALGDDSSFPGGRILRA